MSFGLVIGFGIPFSLASQVILIHTLLLATDVIGIASPNPYVAGALGALFGVGIVVGLGGVVALFQAMPVNMMDGLQMIGDPIVISFAVLPALAVAYQFGARKGLATLAVSLLARVGINAINPITIGDSKVSISADGMALAFGMIMLLGFCIHTSNKEEKKMGTSRSRRLLSLRIMPRRFAKT